MLVCPRRLDVDHGGESVRDLVQPVVVGGLDPVGWGDAGEVRLTQRRPESPVVAEAGQGVDERRVEPLAASLRRHVARRARAVRAVKYLRRLGQAQDPPGQRDLLTA